MPKKCEFRKNLIGESNLPDGRAFYKFQHV